MFGSVISVTPSATTNYTLIGQNLSGCTNTNLAVVSVTVNPLPTITANSTSLSVCAGESITLSGSGANTYTWTNGVLNNVAFVPLLTNTYVVSGTDANGCENNASITVSVVALPSVSASISNSVICFGGTVTLNGIGATSYTWSGNAIDNVPFSPTVSTTYSVSGSEAGCTATNQAVVSITVNALPTVSATVSNTLVCAGQTVTLSGTGASTYSWSDGLMDNVAFTPSVSSTYTVIGTTIEGCKDTAFVKITVNPNPTLTVVSSNNISCEILSATLTVSGANTYTWNTGEKTVSIVVTPTIQTTYAVEGLGENGCINTATFAQIVVCNAIVPDVIVFSGFTPNGDGVNDFWKIDNIREYPKNHVTLFNRWGQKIYDVKGYDNVTNYWPNAEEVSTLLATTYYYIIDLNGDGKKLKKGWVELINK